jgi:O-antigen/teichoic acid export membrane protein
MQFVAQQYPEGLDLYIYTHMLDSGDDGNDLNEINILNHYIGMRELVQEDFNELKWIPLLVGLIMVLTLRAALIGTLSSVLDIVMVSAYFAAFSLWSFWHKLYRYGHDLDPTAAVKVEPFTPPVFGHKMVGQFEVWSYPALGTYVFAAFGILLLAGMILTWRKINLDAD